MKLLVVAFTFICFAFSPAAHAVSPPPDGGYPNNNTAEGTAALFSLTTGADNTAVGLAALGLNLVGSDNTAIGTAALLNNTASQNTATGSLALFNNTTGAGNTAMGFAALFSNTTPSGADSGVGNTAVGFEALVNSTGSFNIALGNNAGNEVTTGSGNIDIGNVGFSTDVETIRIGDIQTATYLAGVAGRTVGGGGTTCVVDNDGKLGVFLSARRFKTDIADMNSASEAVLHLRPVTFRYKPELKATNAPQFGLIAEEVAEVNPDLVTRDATGKLSTVRYEAVNAMLLNEFLKEHREVQELKTTVVQQQKQIETLTASVQKVSAQLELSKAAPQTVLNNQ